MSTSIKNRRRALLAGASGAILATVAVGNVAQAQTVVVDDVTLDALVNAHIAGGDAPVQSNTGAVTGTVDLTDALIDTDGDANGVFENNGNDATASATGNRDGVTASLVTIGSGAALPDDGIAIVAQSLNTGALAAITANSTNGDFGTTGSDFVAGSVDVSGNTATATTVINEGSGTYKMAITGSEPVGYTNLATANASVDLDLSGNAADLANLAGTLVVSSVQVADATIASSANSTGNDFTLTLDSSADSVVNGTATLDANSASSAFTANTRDASIAIAADDATTSVTAAISIAQDYVDNSTTTTNALTDSNNVLATIGGQDWGAIDNDFVDSSLTVSTNVISSSATGNTAAGSIALADGLAYNTAAANTGTAYVDQNNATPALTGDIHADAGLVVAATQVVSNDSLTSETLNTEVYARVQTLDGSSIEMAGNRITSTTLGNSQNSSIASGDASAVFDASAVLVSRQEANSIDISATTNDSFLQAEVGYDGAYVDSTAALTDNVMAASATGNKVRQSIALDAVSLNATVDGQATLAGNLTADALESTTSSEGSVVIASQQGNVGATVTASNTEADISLDLGDDDNEDAQGTNSSITGNVQQAYAIGSDAGNSLSLTGVSVGTQAGITSVQTNDATSTVTATADNGMDAYFDWDLYLASADISGNSQSAIAKGTVAANSLNVDAQTIAVDGAAGNVASTNPGDVDTTVTAAFGIASVQEVLANVSAENTPNTVGSDNQLEMNVLGTVNQSTVSLDDNTVLSQAQGTVATNAGVLNVGTLSSAVAGEGVAGVSNLQVVDGANVTATVRGQNDPVILTDIGSDVLTASVSASGNDILAYADSSKAANSLTVSGTDISGQDTGTVDVYNTSTNRVDAQYGVTNTQIGGAGTVTATLRDGAGGAFDNSSAVLTSIGDDVTDSAVASDANLLQALAASNKGTNSLALDANSLTDVSAGLGNYQTSGQDVTALIGFAGTAGTAPSSVTAGATGTIPTANWSVSGTNVTTTAVMTFTYTATGADETALVAYAQSLGVALANINTTANTITLDPGTYNFGGFDGFTTGTSGGNTTVAFSGFHLDGTPAVPNNGGVMVAIGGTIDSSAVSVGGNTTQGSAIGNSATNSVNVAGTTVNGVDGYGDVTAWTNETGTPEALANADVALSSYQEVVLGSSSVTEVYETFGIEQALDQGITDSSVSVSGNTQYGEALGNTVSNTLSVSGTDLATGATSGGLVNVQDGENASISATSDMQVFANVASSGSNIAMDGNANSAMGVVNNATNVLNASAVNAATASQASATGNTANGDEAQADASFSLANAQNADGTLTTTADSSVYNYDNIDATTAGIVNGSVSLSSNSTRAESTANRAANTVNVAASANLGSTAALINQQESDTAATANASSVVSVSVNGNAPAEAIDGSSVAVEGNSTLALARGNSAANTLNYTAGATYTAAVGQGIVNGAADSVTGDAALLNNQYNTGTVIANATGTTEIVLNADNLASPSVLNGTVSNSNNSVASYAYGNSAANTVMLSALNTGTPNVAVGNSQSNTGAVSAITTTVSFNLNSTGTVGASSFRNNGNTASAVAIGNSAITVIGGQ